MTLNLKSSFILGSYSLIQISSNKPANLVVILSSLNQEKEYI